MITILRKVLLPSSLAVICAMAVTVSSCTPKEAARPQPQAARIALVLGAGAARGFAHIGVLKVLETSGVPVHMIVGTSAGSFVGSLYSYGYKAYELQKTALSVTKDEITDFGLPDNGFIKGDRLEDYVNGMIKNTPIERLRIPFFAIATSVPDGTEMVFGKGNTGKAVRASCAVPGVFRPVRILDRMFVDGGAVSPVGVDAARKYGADIVIAVDISADPDSRQPEGAIDTILQTINIMYSKLAETQLSRADIVIKPKVGHIGSSEFEKRHEAILEGERAAIEMMPRIRGIIERLRQEGRLAS